MEEFIGSILPIAEYNALFALLGAAYGGDGVKTFALPDLRKAAPIAGTHYVIAANGTFPNRP